jgi:hypothetical protein
MVGGRRIMAISSATRTHDRCKGRQRAPVEKSTTVHDDVNPGA